MRRPWNMGTARGITTERWELGLALIALLMFLALAALPVLMIPVHVSRNYNEGWNAYQAAIAMAGAPLYPSADALTANNYPPLSFYIVGLVGRLVGDNVVAGRVVSIVALFLTAWNVGRIGQWLGASRALARLGACWYLLALYTLRPSYIAMNDPQFLAHALVTSGAVLFLTQAAPTKRRCAFASATLVIAAGLVKHNVVALPLAFCTWALFHDRRRLAAFLLSGLLIAIPTLGLMAWLWGAAFFDDVFFHPRVSAWEKSRVMAGQVAPVLGGYLLAGLVGGLLAIRRPAGTLVLAFLVFAGVTGFWWLSGAGVTYNILFDVLMASCLGCVLLISGIGNSESATAASLTARHLLSAVFVLSLVGLNLHYCKRPFAGDIDTLVHRREWADLEQQLAATPGPVACEILAACYWAGKPFELDLFNYGQKLTMQTVPDTTLKDLIGRKYFAYILIEKSSLATPQLPQDTMDWLESNYRPVRVVDGHALLLAPDAPDS